MNSESVIADREQGVVSCRRSSPTHISLFLRLIDSLAVCVSAVVAYATASVVLSDNFRTDPSSLVGPTVVGVVFLACFSHIMKCYWRTKYINKYSIVSRLIVSWTLTVLTLAMFAFLLKSSEEYSRIWSVLWYLYGCIVLCFLRMVAHPGIARMVEEGALAERIVLVGTAETLSRLEQELSAYGTGPFFQVVGKLVLEPRRRPKEWLAGATIGRSIKYTDSFDTVIFAADSDYVSELHSVVRRLADSSVELLALCDPLSLEVPSKVYRVLNGLPLLVLLERPIFGWREIGKRLEDVLVAGAMLIALLPLMAVISVGVRLTGDGPILFRQPRYGRDGKVFEVLKFRTMHHHASDLGAEQLTTRNDARVTPFGKLLRRSSLDELPQLLNVLRGDMSVVGPRPHALSAKAGGRLYEDLYDAYMSRHRVKPGITGWAQIKGWRGETDSSTKLVRRIDYDLQYIENWSLLLDIYIILYTPVSLMKFRDVY